MNNSNMGQIKLNASPVDADTNEGRLMLFSHFLPLLNQLTSCHL
jgi:hypothetical protein